MNEFDIIEKYFAGLFSGSDNVVLAGGDDCAVVNVPEGRELCVSTDTLVTGVHFPRDAAGKVVAHRALAANVSDLAAMGATPLSCVLALTLSAVDHDWLKEFSEALGNLTKRWDIPLVGGNLARGNELSLTFSVLGTVARGKSLRRSGAQPGDAVYVTGSPGEAGAGLAQIQRDAGAASELVSRYLYPEPRIGLASDLVGLATAAIDISDGLVADLEHLCKASQIDSTIYQQYLPLSSVLIESMGRERALTFVLSSGDDYELCFTAPAEVEETLSILSKKREVPITRIGSVDAGSGEVRLVDDDGKILDISARGYRHF